MASKSKKNTTIDKETNIEEISDKRVKSDFYDEKSYKTKSKVKIKGHLFVNTFIVITLLMSLVYFFINITNKDISVDSLINSSILVLFTIIYLVVCLTYNKKSKFTILISSALLFIYYIININNSLNIVSSPTNYVIDLSGKSLTDAVKWANKNNIKIIQDYEYSDMIAEYSVISQDVKVGTSVKDIDSITIAVSDGPNPTKEVMIPSMITWDSERVINFVKKNHLNNVEVEFVESDKVKDTVIEQSMSGNLKRDEELKLTFSYGDEGNENEVKLIDFTNKSKFEIEFFMKQHHLNYNFDEDFSSKVKKDYGVKQGVSAGEMVSAFDKVITVTLSKGPKIKIPNLKNMTVTELTEWAVKNRLKIEFIDKYDDNIKEGNVIDVDKEKGDIVEQGTVIKATLSLGKLKMPKFKDIDEFYSWADKYEIKYEIRREFSNSVKAGDVISYSVKTGKTIKNDEAIIVTISDGENCSVPNLKGLTKNEAISKLKKADLAYNFVYKNSNTNKDKVLSQSISSGSEISCGTTITVTLSNGKGEESTVNKRENSDTNKSSSSNNSSNTSGSNKSNNSNSNNSSSNNSGNNSNNTTTPTTPTKTCNSCTIIPSELKNVISQSVANGGGYQGTANAVISFIEGKCSGIDVQVRGDTTSGRSPGMVVPGSWSGGTTDSCSTVNIILAK